MIEANEPTEGTVVKQETPARITTTMILNDLENGIDRTGIQEKYGLEKWEVTQMFQHPTLKGKKAKKVRKLSFEFVDDSAAQVDSNQMSIEDVEEAKEEIEDVKANLMNPANDDIKESLDNYADFDEEEEIEY